MPSPDKGRAEVLRKEPAQPSKWVMVASNFVATYLAQLTAALLRGFFGPHPH